MILLSDHIVMFCGLGRRNNDNHHVCCIPFNRLKRLLMVNVMLFDTSMAVRLLDGLLGGGFQIVFFCLPIYTWGNDPIGRVNIFSNWVVQPSFR